MRKVYICSPYRAKDGAELDRNIDYAQQLTRQALEAGLAPITPHLYMTQCMDDKKPEERARGHGSNTYTLWRLARKGARHHHLVVNKIDTEILQRCWYKAYEGHNRVKVFPLDDSGNYAELANYLIKYTGTHKKGTDGALQGKRWNCSKNLVRPEPEYHIISDREYFKKEPKGNKRLLRG